MYRYLKSIGDSVLQEHITSQQQTDVNTHTYALPVVSAYFQTNAHTRELRITYGTVPSVYLRSLNGIERGRDKPVSLCFIWINWWAM
jgi:hypothetical protein